ncbi:hypothetical protein GW835_03775 [archaeon]|nr:hypothetical protein [archaeon]NCP79657.1 hypothetical protein [archaeon]NCP97947.1 hypothetical protein [archaeon]NCQ07423.1 hypothetical protein [archaeon]NCQ51214.1 hypothetical protein [archaeon]
MQRLIIVTGATGDLGKEYVKVYSKLSENKVYAISRRKEDFPIEGVIYLNCDLENKDITLNEINKISLEHTTEIVFIHPVGKFKFEENGDLINSIDQEIFKSNLDSFHNVLNPLLLLRKDKNILIKLIAFGSLSDSFNVPWWISYSKSKLALRADMKSISFSKKNICSLFLNLSSVKTFNEHKTRPFAETSFWLSVDEIVKRSLSIIDSLKEKYTEINLYNNSPEYYEGYYKDFNFLKEKWLKEMKG